MSDNKSLTVPPFESKLPSELLEGLDKRDKYLYTKLDEIGQAQAWLVRQSVKHHETLEEVRAQAVATNGRLLAAETDIKTLKAVDEAARPAVEAVQIAMKVGSSKWFWIAAALMLSIGLPWLVVNAPTPVSVIKWAVTLLAG